MSLIGQYGVFARVDRISSNHREISTTIPVRRSIIVSTATFLAFNPRRVHATVNNKSNMNRLFREAFEAGTKGDFDAADKAWSNIIDIDKNNSASWSNRGTLRLQLGRWDAAAEDLQKALDLEEISKGGENVDCLVMNNLANARGAQGRWDDARSLYKRAENDPNVGEIARANYALASFQIGDTASAIQTARGLLRKDQNFLDTRCALVAFLWGEGKESEAENEFRTLQEAQDGLGGEIYSRAVMVQRVANRWPPKCTAALVAFRDLKRTGSALDYDGKIKQYSF